MNLLLSYLDGIGGVSIVVLKERMMGLVIALEGFNADPPATEQNSSPDEPPMGVILYNTASVSSG